MVRKPRGFLALFFIICWIGIGVFQFIYFNRLFIIVDICIIILYILFLYLADCYIYECLEGWERSNNKLKELVTKLQEKDHGPTGKFDPRATIPEER